jgi:putative tricarboxylic transport membrane protein
VVGLLLGHIAEEQLVYTYQISGGQFAYLLERPITIGLVVLLVALVFAPPLYRKLSRRWAVT